MTNNSLWEFACNIYAFENNAELLIQLQDQNSININELISCFWIDMNSLQLNSKQLKDLKNTAKTTKLIIKFIRFFRIALKNTCFYSSAKRQELLLEKLHLHLLEKKISSLNLQTSKTHSATTRYLCSFNHSEALANNLQQNLHKWQQTLLK